MLVKPPLGNSNTPVAGLCKVSVKWWSAGNRVWSELVSIFKEWEVACLSGDHDELQRRGALEVAAFWQSIRFEEEQVADMQSYRLMFLAPVYQNKEIVHL